MKSAQPHALAPYAGMNKEDLLRYIGPVTLNESEFYLWALLLPYMNSK